MRRSVRTPDVLDLNISGDEEEQHRIQLEHNLQNTELSLRLSSLDDNESIEYPRHYSGRTSPEFSYMQNKSYDDAGPHAWSYRTGDDEEGLNPYVGQHTVSTAAHHASAVTLSAGLYGRRGRGAEVSISGAEYDPERPIQNIIAGVDSKLSMFDLDPSRSRYNPIGIDTGDPLVVDNTEELDQVFASGQLSSSRPARIHSPAHSITSEPGSPSRPKLSDALRQVSFSPKRPRNTSPRTAKSTPVAPQIMRKHQSPLRAQGDAPNNDNNPTPKPASRRANTFPRAAQREPEVRLQPPTPVSAMKSGRAPSGVHKRMSFAVDDDAQNPFEDNSVVSGNASMRRRATVASASPRGYNNSRSRIHLPDVTGLTNAVESPAKGMQQRHPYNVEAESRETEVRLLNVINTIQARLRGLEDENSISRRRVRELEHELDMCKQDVARERTRVLERENDIVQIHADQQRRDYANNSRRGPGKGKERARDLSNASFSIHSSPRKGDATARYKAAVEEKKALEALITSLRTHLTRLTAELSSHQQLLHELRTLRESDVQAMQEKSTEVSRLREEVERLAGEIEVLRGVVEEGLRERRAAREASMSQNESEEEEEQIEHSRKDDSEAPEPFDPHSIPGSSRDEGHTLLANRTSRTDRATVGSATPSAPPVPAANERDRFIDDEELERISAEIEDRRSENSADSAGTSQLQSLFVSAEQDTQYSRQEVSRRNADITVPEFEEDEEEDQEVQSISLNRSTASTRHQQPARPSAPTPGHAARVVHQEQAAEEGEAPFPKIRGARLERLFFSAEHDAGTCTMCSRRRRRPGGKPAGANGRPLSPSWLPNQLAHTHHAGHRHGHDEDDEGFEEGSDNSPRTTTRQERADGKRREGGGRDRLPPQTVLARVIKELEDDFGHFKSVYVDLADQYKIMDAASDVPRRNLVAQHLREVIDIIEQKGDQISSLYDLLEFKDKPISA